MSRDYKGGFGGGGETYAFRHAQVRETHSVQFLANEGGLVITCFCATDRGGNKEKAHGPLSGGSGGGKGTCLSALAPICKPSRPDHTLWRPPGCFPVWAPPFVRLPIEMSMSLNGPCKTPLIDLASRTKNWKQL
jgi:hypothetical protein